jgi:hypothetical protein
MKRKPVVFKIQPPVMSDTDFRLMLEGVMIHRENLVRYGTPFPPEKPNSELVEQHKHELDEQIAECKAKIRELELAKERYGQLLRVIYEEESRIKDEQRSRYSGRTEATTDYMQKPM